VTLGAFKSNLDVYRKVLSASITRYWTRCRNHWPCYAES